MARWSLRRRVGTAFAVAGFLSVVGFLFTTAAFANLLDHRERLLDRLDPAVVAGRDFDAALVNQETGVRGFALTGEDSFLEPYRRGRREERAAVARLEGLIGGDPQLDAALRAAQGLGREWRESSAEVIIETVRASTVATGLLDESEARFDAFREASVGLERQLGLELRRAREELDDSTTRLAVVAAGAGLLIVLAAAAIWRALRRWVLQPLSDLGAQTRAVTAGEFARPIEPVGPPELFAVGADTEAMRQRMVAELAKAEEARAEVVAQAEELARSNADLEQFAYVASHDLQEPLRKVTSFCQLLERRYAGQLDERADQYITFAVEGAKRMQLLINDLLAFSRVGRTTEKFTAVDLDAAVGAAVHNLEAAVEDTGATVEVGPLPTVDGDVSLLTTLFQNLVGNAIKFRAEDPPLVRVTAEAVLAERPVPQPLEVFAADGELDTGGAGPGGAAEPDLVVVEWAFAVADNGIGIEPAYAERVFVIFQRLHSKEQYPGTGIGLALCKKIVEFHGGRIWIDTDEGTGTTVRFTLPARSDTPAGAGAGAAVLQTEGATS